MGPGLGEQLVAGGISGNGTGPLNTAPLTGALSRTGDDYSFDVAHSQADVLAGTTPSKGVADLTQVLFQRPTDWPEGDDQGKVNAIAWIGHQMKPKTDDLRAQYWTHALVDDHFDSTFWDGTSNSIVPQIDRLSYPGGQPGFTANDLSWAKGELTQEIAWLIDTHRYLGELATPLDQLQKDSWSKFKGIASDVKNKVKTGDDDQTKVTVGAFFDVSRKFFELAPGAGEAFHAANIIFEAALALEGVGDQSGDDDFRAHANQIAVEFTDRLDKAEHLLQVELPGTISVDYGKLSTIGGCLEGATTCPFDPKDWNYTGPDQDRARPVFATASEVWAYSALLPARYNAYKLPPWWKTNASGEDGYCGITLGLDAVHCPFENQPASAQVAKPIYRNIPTYSHNVTRPGGGGDPVSTGDTWQITALGYLTGSGTLFDPWEMHHPDAGVTDHVFNPPANGGLGLDPETFFDQNFTPQTLDHYPHKETRVHWCANIQDDNCPG